jgi:hypothetical protein
MAHCAICGSKKTADEKTPELCQYFCFWTLEGWLGWNAKTAKVAVKDSRALRFVPTTKFDTASKISYPKMIRMARAMGWTGREDVRGTF